MTFHGFLFASRALLTIIVIRGQMLLLRIHDHISPCDSVPVRIFLHPPSDPVESLLVQPVRRNKNGNRTEKTWVVALP